MPRGARTHAELDRALLTLERRQREQASAIRKLQGDVYTLGRLIDIPPPPPPPKQDDDCFRPRKPSLWSRFIKKVWG